MTRPTRASGASDVASPSAPPTEPMVRIRGLALDARTGRGTAHLLRGIDLDVAAGRILGVVGESGSGKTTLALCLLRLLPGNLAAVRGEIRFGGTDLLALGERAMAGLRGRRIAMIFQDPMTALNPLFTVGTHLRDVLRRRYPALSGAAARVRATEMLGRVGIPDARAAMGAYPHQLSGGMRQRAMIAMALLVEPELLIADEPTTALDATVEAQIVALFARLRREFAGAIVFVSHQLGLVAELCDDLCVMYGGLVVESGPLAEVLAAPRHPYTAALLACEIGEGAEGRLATIAGDVPEPTRPLDRCIFLDRCRHAVAVCQGPPPALRGCGPGRLSACHRAGEAWA